MSGLFAAEAEHVTRRRGSFHIMVTREGIDPAVPADVIVLTRGDVQGEQVLCRVASACVTSTALGSAECDCDLQIDAALERIDKADRGILIYLTHQEGRGHGLRLKVRALANKNAGMDTFAAVEALGEPADVRSYNAVRPILSELGVISVILLTNSPAKFEAVAGDGTTVDRTEPLAVTPHSHAKRSMRAKQARGHVTRGTYANELSLPYP